MLKITELNPDVLQASMGYMKNFLSVVAVVLLIFLILFIISYKHISLEANRSQDICIIHDFSFFSGSRSQEFPLSSIQELRSNLTKSKSSRYVTTFEKPTLLFNNGENFPLLKSRRSVFYTSKLSQNFNGFLKHNQENIFQKKTIYLGVLSTIILSILAAVLVIMLMVSILVGDVKMIFNKKEKTYQIKYLSPIYKDKEGNLADIQNLRIIQEVQTSFSAKQAGLYLELKNQEMILIQALGAYKPEQVTQYLAPIKAKGKQMATFLELELKLAD